MWIVKLDGKYYAGPCQWSCCAIDAICWMDHAIAVYIAKKYDAEVWFRMD